MYKLSNTCTNSGYSQLLQPCTDIHIHVYSAQHQETEKCIFSVFGNLLSHGAWLLRHKVHVCIYGHTCTCFNEMRRKEERSNQGQTNNKAKQHSTPKVVTFPKKNELPRVGLEPTTLYTRTCTRLCMHA